MEKGTIVVDLREFKDFVEHASVFTSEGVIKVEKDKLSYTQLDPANVIMVHFEIKCKSNYKHFLFGVNVSLLYNLLVKFRSSPTFNKDMTLSFLKRGDKMRLVMKDSFMEYELELADIVLKEPKIPNLKDNNVVVNLTSKDFYGYLDMAGVIGESIVFLVEDDKLSLICEGDSQRFAKTGLPVSKVTLKGVVRSKFSVEYLLKRVLKGLLEIRLANDYPLTVKDDRGNWIILAPRVDND